MTETETQISGRLHIWSTTSLVNWASLVARLVKGPPAVQETLNSWVGKILWRRERLPTLVLLDFPCGSAGKESACNAGDLIRSLGCEDPLEKGKANHSSIRGWRIPWIQSMGSQRAWHDWATFTSFHFSCSLSRVFGKLSSLSLKWLELKKFNYSDLHTTE